MRQLVPQPPPLVHNQLSEVRDLFQRFVVPSYGRFELALTRGQGSRVWDVNGRAYLDLGGGIAVCSLGHAHPAITQALVEQSKRLVHVSNLYYQEPQGRLAERIVSHLAPGRVFFCNSGAEANEGLFKLARRFGHSEGRFEILTALNSFHGRTLAGISATGQDKVKHGFEPMVPGFRHVPYNDLEAIRNAISPATVAVLIEGVQGEGGVTPANPEYLLGLRKLCDEHRLLLMMDAVQCGHFRTGTFQSFQRILENVPGGSSFLPDAVSMAKSMGGGFPIGAFWIRESNHGVALSQLLGPGSHATTFGGTPLGCAVALKVFEVIESEGLARHARETGDWLKQQLGEIQRAHPQVLKAVRGLGFMIGIELQPADMLRGLKSSDKPPALQVVHRLHEAGVLTIPAGPQVVRLLPALNLSRPEADEGLDAIRRVVEELAQ